MSASEYVRLSADAVPGSRKHKNVTNSVASVKKPSLRLVFLLSLSVLVAITSCTLLLRLLHVSALCRTIGVFLGVLMTGNVVLLLCSFKIAFRNKNFILNEGIKPQTKQSQIWSCFKFDMISLGFCFGTLAFSTTFIVTIFVLRLERASQTILTDHPGFPEGVKINIDHAGIPHITADSRGDLFFAQGVVMAQMRTFQLEFQRRVTEGRVSALVGEAGLEQDRLFRTFAFHRQAEKTFDRLKSDERFAEEVEALEKLSEGINFYFLNAEVFQAPIEIILLSLIGGISIPESLDKWTPAQSLGWNSVMAYGLSGNLQRELQRFQLLTQRGLSVERIEELFPAYDVDAFPTVLDAEDVCEENDKEKYKGKMDCDLKPELTSWLNRMRGGGNDETASVAGGSSSSLFGAFRPYGNLFGAHGASNAWVVGSNKTKSGKALLANDPHLELTAPSVWMLFHLKLKTEKESIFGASLLGLPGVVLGHNSHIAWGVTDTGADIQDLFVLDVINSTHYRHGNSLYAFSIRKERIKIAGSTNDYMVEVKEADQYGPILSDAVVSLLLNQKGATLNGHIVALKWVDIDEEEETDTTFPAFYRIMFATNFEEFRQALSLFIVPGQNFVFASGSDIGYQMTGRLPIRKPGHNGLYPVPGNASYDWKGFLPFDELPYVFNPKKGFIVTANNQVQPPCFRKTPTCDWDGVDGYRAQRITSLIDERNDHSAASMADVQADIDSPFARDMSVILRRICDSEVVRESVDADIVCQLLVHGTWDSRMKTGWVEPSLFHEWIAILYQVNEKETGLAYWPQMYATKLVFESALNISSSKIVGTCASGMTHKECRLYAERALIKVGKKYRAGQIKPWGLLNTNPCSFTSQVFDSTPLKCLMSRSVIHSGDASSVNVGSYELPSFRQKHGSSYRHISTFAGENFKGSMFINGLGQNGNPLSWYYDSMLMNWASGEYFPMWDADSEQSKKV